MIRLTLLSFLILFISGFSLKAQPESFHITSVSTGPSGPTTCDSTTVIVNYKLSYAHHYLGSTILTKIGNDYHIDLMVTDPGGFGIPVLSSKTAYIQLDTIRKSGTYNVFVRYFTNSSLMDQDTSVFTVSSFHNATISPFVSQQCRGDTLNLNTSGSFFTYEWVLGGQLVDTGLTASIPLPDTGLQELELVVFGGACRDTVTDTVTVTGVVDSFSFTPAGPFEYRFEAADTSQLSYYWDFGDSTVDSGAIVTHQYSTAGNYEVCLTASTQAGCISTSCDSVKMIVSNRDTELLDVSVYPNPTSDRVFVNSGTSFSFRLTDLNGNKIAEGQAPAGKTVINTEKLHSGIYLFNLQLQSGASSYRKILIK